MWCVGGLFESKILHPGLIKFKILDLAEIDIFFNIQNIGLEESTNM